MSIDIAGASNDRFTLEELFFSRTDTRGVILSGNTVFQRVSGFEWNELIGAPHKLVRNPDMPKGVFHMVWKALKAKEPIAAYICNKTKDGEHYWVFATIFPMEEGYLSIRMNPASGLLEKVVPIYEELTARERDGTFSPEQSEDAMREHIRQLGFFSYSEFMAIALTREMAARNAGMQRPQDPTLEALSETLKSTGELEACANRVNDVFRDTHQIPYNMRLQAGRIEGSDGPISVISGNHRQMSQGLETIVDQFRISSRATSEAICQSSFQIALAQMLREMKTQFSEEQDENLPMKQEILGMLGSYAVKYRDKSLETLNGTAVGMKRFRKQCRHMRRALSGLELTRIMCKIERYKIDGEHSGLDEIVTRLAYAQKALEDSCNEIERVVAVILNYAEDILREQQAQKAA